MVAGQPSIVCAYPPVELGVVICFSPVECRQSDITSEQSLSMGSYAFFILLVV